MIELIYVSAARTPFSRIDLSRLLQKARIRNGSLGISGMLLHEAGSFLQVLEGEPAAVQSLFIKIGADVRHHRLMKLLETRMESRNFAEWSMGFATVDQELGGANALMSEGFSPSEFLSGKEPFRAKEVLMAFRAGRFRAHVDADASLGV